MRQKLIEAYTFDYSPPPTPGYLNEAVNDIQAKVTKDGVQMTNISEITNTKNRISTTNLNEVGTISFKNGMKMTTDNNAISGLNQLNSINVSGNDLSNVGTVNGHSIVRPPNQHAFYQKTSMIDATTIQSGDTILIGVQKDSPPSSYTVKLPFGNGLWVFVYNQTNSKVKVSCDGAKNDGSELNAPQNMLSIWLCAGNEWRSTFF